MNRELKAHLPLALAAELSEDVEVEAVSARGLSVRNDLDREILKRACSVGAAKLIEEADSVDLIRRFGYPPQEAWITTGNSTSACALLDGAL